MKSRTTTAVAMLVAGILGAYAWAPVYSATGDSGYTEPAPAAAPSSGSQSPMGTQPSESMAPGKSSVTCARLDKNNDGFITWPEFKPSGKADTVFKSADAEHRGKLSMEECNKALSG